jgi:hypothetical protein
MIRNLKTAIIFHYKLWWLKRQRENTRDEIDDEMQQAKSEDDRDEIWQTRHWEIQESQQAVQELQTRYYGVMARRKGIPTSNRPEDWQRLLSTKDVRILTVDAIAQLRSRLRQEHKELRDVILPYAAIIISVAALAVAFLNFRKPVTPQQQITHPQPTQAIASPTPTPALATKPKPTQPHQSKP